MTSVPTDRSCYTQTGLHTTLQHYFCPTIAVDLVKEHWRGKIQDFIAEHEIKFSFPVSRPHQIFTFTFLGHTQTSHGTMFSYHPPPPESYDCFCFLLTPLSHSPQTSCFTHRATSQLPQNTVLSLLQFQQRSSVFFNRSFREKQILHNNVGFLLFNFHKHVLLIYRRRPQVLYRKGRLPACFQLFFFVCSLLTMRKALLIIQYLMSFVLFPKTSLAYPVFFDVFKVITQLSL